ncbi:S-layer homology domain-containing protein [Caldanaerobius polysaccharolyticus]|uniref:S-layer homology domain-containing protein n=1 Tax=Caldanaerobius polysaccharolyticus TaxID=44256 RepID=UPI000478DD89|nr:S-layer homology domain-containing protein [Caldanaerobius polysaccharolyticus]
MRSFKKALAFVLTVALVLSSMMVFAFADTNTSTYPDVNGTDYATAVNTLTSLGIVNGYPGGTFGVDKNITRAEVAKMIVGALNLNNAANLSKSVKKFSDVKPSDWFAGYVNVAASKGIVKGYGNGKFGPNDNVTYDQVLIMLVRALGYNDNDIASAKTYADLVVAYTAKADEEGIIGDVEIVNGVPATRGDVAKLLYNALNNAKIAKTDSNGNKVDSDNVLLSKLASTATYTILATPDVDSSVSAGNVNTDKGSVATAIDLNNYLGKKVEVYVSNNSKKIVGVKSVDTSDSDVLTFTESDNSVGNTVYYKDGDTLKTVTVGDSTPVVYNGVKTTFKDVRTNQKVYAGANVTLINNDGTTGYDYMIVDNSFSSQAVRVAKDVTSSDKYINNTTSLSIDPSKTIIVKGAVSKVTDIKANDIIYYGTSIDGNKITILVVRNTVSGKVTEAGPDFIVVNGTKYTVKGISVPAVNTEGTWVLDKDNNIVYQASGTTTTTYYAVALLSDLNNAWDSKIKLFKSDGTTVVMSAVYDNVYNVSVGSGVLVDYTVNSDGKINSIEAPSGVSSVSATVYSANNRIVIDGTTYYVDSNTVLFNKKTSDNSYSVIKLSDIKDGSTNTVQLVADEYHVVKAALFTNADTSTTAETTKTVLVKTYAAIDGGVRIYVDENGVEKTYDSTRYTTSDFSKNTFYKLTFDANNKVIGKAVATAVSGVTVSDIDTTNYKVAFSNGQKLLMDNNVMIYQKNSDGTYSVKGLGDVTKDATVDYYLNDNGKVCVIVLH